ncbi:hypothetical protein BXO88_03920 [Oribacterium sp. C9]|nr:hypothetical protein BXO88_03920 [Oribacterium sp. C9]
MKLKLLGAVAFAAAFLMGITPVTAFANIPDCTCVSKCTEDYRDTDCPLCKTDISMCEGKEPETEPEVPETVKMGPLTPDGNMNLVDDYGTLEAGGKQFITVVSKTGNYFYIIIDRDDEGEETVHFLNLVDEADLLKLMDEEEAKQYLENREEKNAETVTEPETDPEPVVEDPVPVKPEKKNNVTLIMALILLSAIGCTAGYVYFSKVRKRKVQMNSVDPDADYNEDESEYQASLPDDMDEDPDFDFEEDEDDAEGNYEDTGNDNYERAEKDVTNESEEE